MNAINASTPTAMADDEINLLAVVSMLLDYKWLIAAFITIFTLFGIAYALLASPVYEADALLQIESTKSSLPGMKDLAELTGKAPEAMTEIELIKSRWVVGKAVEAQHLDIFATPLQFPIIGGFIARRFSPDKKGEVAGNFIPFTGKYDWGGAEITVEQLDVPDGLLDKPLTLVAGENGSYILKNKGGETLLAGSVGGLSSGQNINLKIKYLHSNPGQYFVLVKYPLLELIDKIREELKVAERGKNTGIISMSFQDRSHEFAKRTLNEVAQQYVQQNAERKSEEAASSLKFVREQLPQVRAEMDRATTALNRYQVDSKSVDISAETASVLDQIVRLETNISELEMKKLELDKLFTPAHPAYQTTVQQLRDLQARKKNLEEKVGDLPTTQQELLKLTRDVQVSTEIYTLLQSRAQELDIIRAGTVGNARVVDKSEVDVLNPAKPQRVMIVLIAAVLGGALGVMFAALHVMLTRGVEDPSDIEAMGVAVSATIPFSEIEAEAVTKALTSGPLPLLMLTHPTDPSVEAIRSLRTGIHFQMMDAPNNVIAISGPSPEVGKTFVSANLAVAMAQAGKTVLLIDADMRKGYMQRFFGLESTQAGLSSLLGRGVALEEVTVHTAVKGLDFVARGPVPKNPSELLLSPLFGQFMKHASAEYDVVIIDTPPILAVADPIIVSKLAGSNYIVARFSKNPLGEIQATIKRFENHGVRLSGIVLNATFKRSLAYYGYQKYGYGSYQYEYYGVDSKKSRSGKDTKSS